VAQISGSTSSIISMLTFTGRLPTHSANPSRTTMNLPKHKSRRPSRNCRAMQEILDLTIPVKIQKTLITLAMKTKSSRTKASSPKSQSSPRSVKAVTQRTIKEALREERRGRTQTRRFRSRRSSCLRVSSQRKSDQSS
jgi:hypothetical protein